MAGFVIPRLLSAAGKDMDPMHGKHSLTASVVAIGGPGGPRYYPGSLSANGATALASEIRQSHGGTAVAIEVDLEMPDPLPFLIDATDKPARLVASAIGDDSTYYGSAEFERLRNRWTVWITEVHSRERPGLIAACRTLRKAMKEADVDRGPLAEWAAIIIGPGYGGVRVDNITLWPHAWTVRTVIDEEIYPEESVFPGSGDPVDREQAKELATAIANSDSCGITGCPIITAPYRPVAKGGAQ